MRRQLPLDRPLLSNHASLMLIDFDQFAWRDGILVVAVLAGVYLAVTFLRLMQVGKRRQASLDLSLAPAVAGVAPHPSAASGTASEAEATSAFPEPAAGGFKQLFRAARQKSTAGQDVAAPAAVPPAPSFAAAPEVTVLREEVNELRYEVAALREQLLDVQASRRVSPQYADAMALARRGLDASGIANHCGIALGEAELVMALARGAEGFDGEDDYVGSGYGAARH